MAKLGINTGSAPNDGTGDSLLSGAIKINSNFDEIYNAIGNGTSITNSIGYATSSGFSTTSGYSSTSGISSYSANSGIATYSNESGISGSANYANSSGVSTVAEYAQNLTGTPNIEVGVLTASSLNGDGSGLTNIISNIVAGSGVTVSLNGTVATVSASGIITGGAVTSSQWLTVASGIVTTANVGIGTTATNSALQVHNGTISLTGNPGSDIAISLEDSHKITLGDSGSSDSSIFFDGSNLNLRSSGTVDISDNSGRLVISAVTGEGAILYYDNDKKLQTLDTGVYIAGDLGVLGIVTATNLNVSGVSTFSGDVNISEGTSLDFGNNGGDLHIYRQSNANDSIIKYDGSYDFRILTDSLRIESETGSFTKADFSSGSVSLYGGGASGGIKLQTLGTGVTVTGTTFTNDLRVSDSVGIGTTNAGYYLNAGSYPTTLTTTNLTVGSVGSAGTTLLVNGEAIIDGMNIHCGGSGPIWNAYFGYDAGRLSNGGNLNAAFGPSAFRSNVSGNWNAAFGANALQNATGSENSAFGSSAGSSITGGQSNTLIGRASGTSITNGFSNTFLGYYSGNQTTGSGNLFLGSSSGQLVTSGEKNVIIGSFNGNNGSSGLDIRASSNNIVIADGDANIRFYANSSGNVGLGTTNPTSALTVNGSITVNNGGVALATNNATIVGTLGTAGEIKQIGGAPFYYDGSAWREFVLSSGTPVTVPADTEWDNVVFRATFDDDFTDAKFGATPVRVSAGATIVGAAVTIGTGAYSNIGGNTSGVGVAYTYRSEYDFTGSWTIEFWIYHDSTPSTYESLVSQVSTIDDSGDWTLGMYNNGFNIYVYWANENGASNLRLLDADGISAWNTQYLDKWTHYALVREADSGSLHFYVNGTETSYTTSNSVIDNDILHINGAELGFGAAFGNNIPNINGTTWNSNYSIDAIFDDVRISCGVGTAGQRYNSIGIHTYATFTPPTTALPTTGTLSSVVNPPGDKYGEIILGGSPTWRGTSGVTVTQQSSGNYRVSFASSYTNANDYYVLSQGMDQGFASYVGIARSTTHVDFAINRQSDDAAVDTGSLSVQIKNHI